MLNNVEKGKKGEEAARLFLSQRGYNIIKSNFRSKNGEIDIVAFEENKLVFIEVKSRKSTRFGLPIEAVNYKKQQKIKIVACDFISSNSLWNRKMRFDIVEVMFDFKYDIKSLNLVKDAFY